MRLLHRLVITAALSAALIFSGCGSNNTPSGDSPDSGTPDIPEQPVGWPQLAVNPPSVDVGAVDVGVTSYPVVVTVTNVGTAMSGPLSVIVSGTGIMASGCEGVVLAPKESCQISVSARLTVLGPVGGTIEVGDTPTNTKKIAVSGVHPIPGWLSLSPAPLDLGTVVTGKTVTGTIVLTNAATQDLTGFVINVSGVGFTLSPTGNCTDTLALGQSCNIDVSFTAGVTPGPAKGTLSVSQGGVTNPVALTAMVEQPAPLTPPWDQARIGNTGTSWWMNVVKGKFFLSIKLRVSTVEDTAGRAEVVSIANLLANKSGSTALELAPLPSELPGTWIYDPGVGETEAGPVVATTFEQATNYIDGGADPFYNSGVIAKMLVWGNYLEGDSGKDTPHSLDLRIWEMASASDASTLYTNLLQNPLYSPSNVPWIPCQGGDATNPCP